MIQEWDAQGLTLVNEQWRNAFFDDLMPMLSSDPLFWGIIFGVVLTYVVMQGRGGLRRLPLPVLFLLLSLGISDLTALGAKNIVDRPRPAHVLPGVYTLSDGKWERNPHDFTPRKSGGSSFYSGHSTNSMAIAATLTAIIPQSAPFVYLLPLGVGYSRLYLGKHYPSDILAGWLAGWVVGKVCGRLYRATAAYLRRRMRRPA